MEPLVSGIFQCPKCKLIIKEKIEKIEKKEVEEKEDINEILKDGKIFNLNRKYEIPEKGIIVRDGKFAVLICHSADLKSVRYIRLSWWKNSFIQHVGMIKITEKEVLKNLIIALEKIDEAFDGFWGWHGTFGKKKEKTEEQKQKEKQYEIIKYRIIENRTCPNCHNRMKKAKFHYECTQCGEIVILEGYNQPIFSRDTNDLSLDFEGNFPVNYYMPLNGITIKKLISDWKALVIIYSKDNLSKKWLRIYWWVRYLSIFMKSGGMGGMGHGTQMGWSVQKGAGSTNIYDKKEIKILINALKRIAKEINWEI